MAIGHCILNWWKTFQLLYYNNKHSAICVCAQVSSRNIIFIYNSHLTSYAFCLLCLMLNYWNIRFSNKIAFETIFRPFQIRILNRILHVCSVIELIQFTGEKKEMLSLKKIVVWCKMEMCIHSQLHIHRFIECKILNVKCWKCNRRSAQRGKNIQSKCKKMQISGCDKLIETQTKQPNWIRNSANSILRQFTLLISFFVFSFGFVVKHHTSIIITHIQCIIIIAILDSSTTISANSMQIITGIQYAKIGWNTQWPACSTHEPQKYHSKYVIYRIENIHRQASCKLLAVRLDGIGL